MNDTRRTRIFSGVAFGGAVLFTIIALACMFADADDSKTYIVGAFLLIVMILGLLCAFERSDTSAQQVPMAAASTEASAR